MKVYIDFDCTLVDTVTAFVTRYNNLYSKRLDPNSVKDYDFCKFGLNNEEIERGFNSDFFFSELQMYPNVVESLIRMKECGAELILITRGTLTNIQKKIQWFEKYHYVKDLFTSFIFATHTADKIQIDMKDSILIDDQKINHINSNAKHKFAFRDIETRNWFPTFEEDGVKVCNSWKLIADSICELHSVKVSTNNKRRTRYNKYYNKNKKKGGD